MKKKLLSVILGLATALVIGNSQAAVTSVHAEEIPELDYTNEELFELYAIETLGLNGDEVSAERGEYAREYLNELSKDVYDTLKVEFKKVADGERDNAIVSIYATRIDGFKSKYTKEDLGVEAIKSGGSLTPAAKEAFLKKIQEQFDAINVKSIDHALLWDCPYEMYWYMKTDGCSMGTSEYSFDFNEESVFLVDCDNILINFSYTVDPAYRSDASDKYSVNTSKTGAAKTAAATAKTIVDNAKDLSDYDKLVAYKEAICNLTEYNYDAAAAGPKALGTIAPWQIIYVFDNNPATSVVCEGYAKSFAYLCDLTEFKDDDITVYTVSGYMGENANANGAHMWNVVHMNDDANYLTDITNCDTNTVGAPDKLFLRGAGQAVVDSEKNVKGYIIEVENQNPQYYLYDNETFESLGWDELAINNVDYDPSGKVIKKPNVLSADCGSVTLKEYEGYEYSIDNKTWQKSSVFSGLVDGTEYTFYQRIAKNGETPASDSQSLLYKFEAIPHDFGDEFTVDKAPTCTEDGIKSIHCSVCGSSKDAVAIPAFGHDWDEGVFTKKPTFTEKGAMIYTCKNDSSHKKTVEFPTLATSGDVVDEDIEYFTEEEFKGNAIKVIGVSDAQYTGSAITFDIRVYKGNKLLKEGKEYSVKYLNNKNACTDTQSRTAPTVTITGKGAYKNEEIKPIPFKIIPIDLANSSKVCVSNDSAYLSRVGSPVPVITVDGKKLKVGVDYDVVNKDSFTSAGVYEIKLDGKNNYSGTVKSKYTVVDDSTGLLLMSKAKVSGYLKTFKYNPNGAITQDLSKLIVKIGSTPLDAADYTVSYINNTEVGTASMIVKAAKGSEKVAGEKIVTFKIAGTPISKAKASYEKALFYTGKTIKQPNISLALSDGTILKQDKDYTISYVKNVNAGTASIIITGKGAYTGVSKKTFKIKPVELTSPQIKVSANSISIREEGGYTTYDVIVKNNDKPLVKDVDYTVSYKKTKDSNVLTAIIKGKWNYIKSTTFSGPLK